jgi:hypothetical protein
MFGSLGIPEIIVLLATIFWIWMLIDVLTKERGENRLVWVLVVILLGPLGALIYFIVRRSKR